MAAEVVERFGLSESEYVVQLILTYTGEVGNGGHAQFFLNRGGRYGRDTLDAVRTVGLAEHNAILRAAIAVFPGGSVPDTPEDTEAAMIALSDSDEHALAQLDERLFRLSRVVDEALLAYLREHQHDILVAERA